MSAKTQTGRPAEYPQSRAMIHLNNNLMCAIDIKTTGPNPFYDEIYEICIMPIGADGYMLREIAPFNTQICPLHVERIKFDERMTSRMRKRLNEAINSGIDYGRAIDHLDEWIDRLDLPFRKRIFPIAYNWPLINAFLYKWLDFIHMNSIFSYQYRDILVEANFINDYCDFHNRRCSFSKTDYSYILGTCKIDHERGNWDTLENCRNIAEVHRLLLRDAIISLPPATELEYDEENKHMQTNDRISAVEADDGRNDDADSD